MREKVQTAWPGLLRTSVIDDSGASMDGFGGVDSKAEYGFEESR